jgi:hypothetical protein
MALNLLNDSREVRTRSVPRTTGGYLFSLSKKHRISWVSNQTLSQSNLIQPWTERESNYRSTSLTSSRWPLTLLDRITSLLNRGCISKVFSACILLVKNIVARTSNNAYSLKAVNNAMNNEHYYYYLSGIDRTSMHMWQQEWIHSCTNIKCTINYHTAAVFLLLFLTVLYYCLLVGRNRTHTHNVHASVGVEYIVVHQEWIHHHWYTKK